jgi:hypothetical protein
MKPLTEADIRSSFVNASRGDAERLWLPGLHEVVWNDREYLGWRDVRMPLRGAIVFWRGDRPVGIMLRAAETSMTRGRSAMCLLCQTPQPADQVSLFSAPRAGDRGRNGDSVGTYICADLGCSHMIRMGLPPKSDMTPPADHVIARRAAGLGQRLEGFTANVLKTA